MAIPTYANRRAISASRVIRPPHSTAAKQSIPALIPAFCRAGVGFSETSRTSIASVGAGLRGVVGCRENHLGLLDHQQHLRSIQLIEWGVLKSTHVSYPL